MFQICSWNVQGLNDLSKMCLVKSVVSRFRRCVLCFQESKVDKVSRSFLHSSAGSNFDKCQFINSDGASGGLITCWSLCLFSCSKVIIRRFSLTIHLLHSTSGSSFYVTNVYGPPTWNGKEEFCAELAVLKVVCRGPWVLCGDFNMTRNLLERRGRSWSGRLMNMFTDLINDLELIDLPLGNQSYTWSNMQSTPMLAKLDRFLDSMEWTKPSLSLKYWRPLELLLTTHRFCYLHATT